MARSKSYKRKNVHNLRKSRQYKHLGGNMCNLTITTKKNIDVILPEEFKKKDFFDMTYNQNKYRVVWDISWLDKTLNKGTYSFLIYKETNNNFNTEPEKMKSIDLLLEKMKDIFKPNSINCLTKMSAILSPQSKDDTFKDNVFTHLRNKLQLVIANSRIATVDINKKRRDNLIIYRNQLFVCKIRKEYPDIYNKLITTELDGLSIFNNLNTELELGQYDSSIKSLADKIKTCNAKQVSTNSQAQLIEDLQKQILELKNKPIVKGDNTDQISGRTSQGNSDNDVCKSNEIKIYREISKEIYQRLYTYFLVLGVDDKSSSKTTGLSDPEEGTELKDVNAFKRLNKNNFTFINEAIQTFKTTHNRPIYIPSSPTPSMSELDRRKLAEYENYEKLRFLVDKLLISIRPLDKPIDKHHDSRTPSHSNDDNICKENLRTFLSVYPNLRDQIRRIVPGSPGM